MRHQKCFIVAINSIVFIECIWQLDSLKQTPLPGLCIVLVDSITPPKQGQFNSNAKVHCCHHITCSKSCRHIRFLAPSSSFRVVLLNWQYLSTIISSKHQNSSVVASAEASRSRPALFHGFGCSPFSRDPVVNPGSSKCGSWPTNEHGVWSVHFDIASTYRIRIFWVSRSYKQGQNSTLIKLWTKTF